MTRLRIPLLSGTLFVLSAFGAAPAFAHVEIAPEEVTPRSSHEFVLSVANAEKRSGAIVGIDVRIPRGLVVATLEAKAGWSARSSARLIGWRRGAIPSGQFATFAFRAYTQAGIGKVTLLPRLRYASGRAHAEKPIDIRVTAKTGDPAIAARDEDARTLGRFALGLALAAAVLGAAGAFGALALWLVAPNRSDRERNGTEAR